MGPKTGDGDYSSYNNASADDIGDSNYGATSPGMTGSSYPQGMPSAYSGASADSTTDDDDDQQGMSPAHQALLKGLKGGLQNLGKSLQQQQAPRGGGGGGRMPQVQQPNVQAPNTDAFTQRMRQLLGLPQQ
jgi:hypothetical protein